MGGRPAAAAGAAPVVPVGQFQIQAALDVRTHNQEKHSMTPSMHKVPFVSILIALAAPALAQPPTDAQRSAIRGAPLNRRRPHH